MNLSTRGFARRDQTCHPAWYALLSPVLETRNPGISTSWSWFFFVSRACARALRQSSLRTSPT